MDSTAESGGGQFAGTKHDQEVRVFGPSGAGIEDGANSWRGGRRLQRCLCGPEQTERGKGEGKKTESKKKLPRIVDNQDNEA